MRANELLDEGIIDKLKGAFKKKSNKPINRIEPEFSRIQGPSSVTDVTPKYEKPRSTPKLGYAQQVDTEPDTSSPAIGQMATQLTKPKKSTQPGSSVSTAKTNWSDPAAQARLSKSIILALDKVKDPTVLNNINLMLQDKIKKAKAKA